MLADPDVCRSTDCNQKPQWYAYMAKRRRYPGNHKEQWKGYFCTEHLDRVLPLMLPNIGSNDLLVIRKA